MIFDSLLDLISPPAAFPLCASELDGAHGPDTPFYDTYSNQYVPPNVKIVWHTILGESDAGAISTVRLGQQVQLLNTAYTGVARFNTFRTVVYRRPEWYAQPFGWLYQNVVRHNIQSPDRMLNVFTSALPQYAGMSHFPWDAAAYPTLDAVLVREACVTGGSQTSYNLGQVLVHEVGHWGGLLHPWGNTANGCGDLLNDGVIDTPPCAGPSYNRILLGCPKKPGKRRRPRIDRTPMHYGSDSLPRAFTAGQRTRMRVMLATYRGGLFA